MIKSWANTAPPAAAGDDDDDPLPPPLQLLNAMGIWECNLFLSIA